MSRLICRLGRALVAVCVITIGAPAYAQTAPPAAPKPEQKPADTANLPSARSIIDKHIDAIGGRKALASHKSARLKGTMSMPANGMTGNLEIQTARPNKSVMKLTIEGVGSIEEGFDGERGWSVSPMTGPMLTTGPELEERKFDSDFDGGLRDDSRYEYMKTAEKTTFEGRPVYKVVLKRKGGKTEDIEYYDAETGLKAGGEVTRNSPMGAVSVVSIQSDYKKFGDVLQPTTLKQKVMGIEQIMSFTSIEYDVVEPTAFEIPAAVKALIK